MLFDKVINYYFENDHTSTYIFDGFAGADLIKYTLPVRVIAKKGMAISFL